MNISVTSLTDHRIDKLFAEYIATALNCKLNDEDCDFLIVTNGMYESADPAVLQKMKEVPSLYLIDDHTCWVPDLTAYPDCKILSQFTRHPVNDTDMTYFQVSKLALFDSMFDDLQPQSASENEVSGGWLYWGQYKPERHAEYSYIDADTLVIGRRYPEKLSKNWVMKDFDKSMGSLHTRINNYALNGYLKTRVFGDKLHNGVNLPYRIYEAFMCGIMPIIHPDLLGSQELDMDWLKHRLKGTSTDSDYKYTLDIKRVDVIDELMAHIVEPIKFSDEVVEEFKKGISEEFPINDSVDEILAERGTIYGSYRGGVMCRATMMDALNDKHIECKGKDLPESVRVVFSDIILKLMRAASDPSHEDSWLDLAGYAKIINKMVEEDSDVFTRQGY